MTIHPWMDEKGKLTAEGQAVIVELKKVVHWFAARLPSNIVERWGDREDVAQAGFLAAMVALKSFVKLGITDREAFRHYASKAIHRQLRANWPRWTSGKGSGMTRYQTDPEPILQNAAQRPERELLTAGPEELEAVMTKALATLSPCERQAVETRLAGGNNHQAGNGKTRRGSSAVYRAVGKMRKIAA